MSDRLVIRNKRLRVVICLFAVLGCAAVAFSYAKHLSQRLVGEADVSVGNERLAQTFDGVNERSAGEPTLPPVPQTSAQFDLSRNVIAGGGGTSNGGNFKLEGTVGQSVAGTTSLGGAY